ncbi:MAG TPA: hypothetical protein PLY91_10435 [Methanoregulaceae archaeon]|nr:hypothetical protein [Methanoregulaceae archaeon]
MPEKDLGLLDRIGKELHLQVGTYLLSCNDPIGALREFDAALGIDTADGAVVLQKARALSAIGRWVQAMVCSAAQPMATALTPPEKPA